MVWEELHIGANVGLALRRASDDGARQSLNHESESLVCLAPVVDHPREGANERRLLPLGGQILLVRLLVGVGCGFVVVGLEDVQVIVGLSKSEQRREHECVLGLPDVDGGLMVRQKRLVRAEDVQVGDEAHVASLRLERGGV
eukprot:scaffold99903_cov26-Tisochrysis_lutea.AAC.4